MTTYLGRVVYDRKKHVFRMKDVIRIIKQIPMEDEIALYGELFNEVTMLVLARFQDLITETARNILLLALRTVLQWAVGVGLKSSL